ncbi:MAG: histidine kinase, partial [Ginsengibacter sp.]
MLHFSGYAQKSGREGIEMRKNPPQDSVQVLEAIRLSREMHKSHPDEEKEYSYAQKAVNMALDLKDTLLYARALDNLGILYRFHQQYSQSLPLHVKAFELIKDKSVPSIHKMIFANNAGVAARYGEKYDQSVFYYLEALKLAERENNLKNIAISSNGLGIALGNIPGRQTEALDYLNRALITEKDQGNNRGVAMNLLSIGHYYIDNRDFSQAREHLTKLLELNEKFKDEHGIAITLESLGLSYLYEGKDYKKADDYFQDSYDRFQNLNNNMKKAELLSFLGKSAMSQNKKSEAINYYKKSQTLIDSIAHKGLMAANALSMSEIYESINQPADALKHYKIAQRFKDSIALHNQSIKIAALTQNFEIEKKESHIEQLELEKEQNNKYIVLQEEKINQQQAIIWLIIITVISILSIFAMQFKNAKQKQKLAKQLEQQEKEKLEAIYERNLAQAEMLATRMKINPHFLFNSLNAINNLIQGNENRKASKYLIVFSRFVRMVLETSKTPVISLKEELDLIDKYLTLEENRFDQNFSYRILQNEETDSENIFIPPLLLQPFVENAIWHGLLPSQKEKKELTIRIHSQNQKLEISIEDNGVGRKTDKKFKPLNSHKSMGTEITQKRIDLFNDNYENKILCNIEDKTDENGNPAGTFVRLT